MFWGEFSPHSLTSPLPIPRDADRHQPVHFKSLFCELEGWGGPRTGKGSVDSGRGGLRGPRQLHQPQQQGPGRPVQLGGVALVGGARAAVEARAIPALGLVGAALCGEKGLSSPAAPGTRPRSPHPPAHTPGSHMPAPSGPRDGLRTSSSTPGHRGLRTFIAADTVGGAAAPVSAGLLARLAGRWQVGLLLAAQGLGRAQEAAQLVPAADAGPEAVPFAPGAAGETLQREGVSQSGPEPGVEGQSPCV